MYKMHKFEMMVFPFLFGPLFLSLDFYNHLPPLFIVPLDSHN